MKFVTLLIAFICLTLFILPVFSSENKILVKVCDDFKIELESNPTTGYQWQLAKTFDKNLIKMMSSKFISSNTNLEGAGGKEVWTFKGVKKGKSKIYLDYARPWESVKPIMSKTYEIEVIPK